MAVGLFLKKKNHSRLIMGAVLSCLPLLTIQTDFSEIGR